MNHTERDPNGVNQHTSGAKLDVGKNKWHLLPLLVIEGAVEALTFGAAKYTDSGWKNVPDGENRYFSAMMRHYLAIKKGEHIDPDSGLAHWKHFLCSAIFMCYFFSKDKAPIANNSESC